MDDDFLDPVTFRGDSFLGAAGLFHAYRAGNLVLANAPGTGVADDKSIYAYVPRIIRYFLGEEPILANVETHLCREPEGLAYTLDHLHELVVKEVGGSGGYGMLIGPHASAAEREIYAARLRADPANFIAQPTLALSRSPPLPRGSNPVLRRRFAAPFRHPSSGRSRTRAASYGRVRCSRNSWRRTTSLWGRTLS